MSVTTRRYVTRARKVTFGFLFLALSLGSFFKITFADSDSVLVCKSEYDSKIDTLRDYITKTEDLYVKYRWAESKIRFLYYNHLWQVHLDLNHPLSKEKRINAADEEKRLLIVLDEYEKHALDSSNELFHVLDLLRAPEVHLSQVCDQLDYQDCIRQPFNEWQTILETMQKDFNHIFERERDYRRAVKASAGDKKGYYLDEILEQSDEHMDSYWRFESEKEETQYRDDKMMMEYFHQLHKILTWNFAGDNCCYRCVRETLE